MTDITDRHLDETTMRAIMAEIIGEEGAASFPLPPALIDKFRDMPLSIFKKYLLSGSEGYYKQVRHELSTSATKFLGGHELRTSATKFLNDNGQVIVGRPVLPWALRAYEEFIRLRGKDSGCPHVILPVPISIWAWSPERSICKKCFLKLDKGFILKEMYEIGRAGACANCGCCIDEHAHLVHIDTSSMGVLGWLCCACLD